MDDIEALSDVDQMLLWLEDRVHYIDNIRRVRGQWSLRLWLRHQASSAPLVFTHRTIEGAVGLAVEHVLTVRAEQRARWSA